MDRLLNDDKDILTSVISSDPSCKDGNAQFTIVP